MRQARSTGGLPRFVCPRTSRRPWRPIHPPSEARSGCARLPTGRSRPVRCCSAAARSSGSCDRARRSGRPWFNSVYMRVEALVFDAYGTLYDVHSVVRRCETCFPGKGTALSQLWRAKQLEYTWQRSLMQRYAPFSQVTREALAYSCAALGLQLGEHELALMEEYLRLAPFPEVRPALARLAGKKAILSNGSPDLLEPLVRNSRLPFHAPPPPDDPRPYTPAPHAPPLPVRPLALAPPRLGLAARNPRDALGAKSYGFTVYWINRTGAPVDALGFAPDAQLESLSGLADEILR